MSPDEIRCPYCGAVRTPEMVVGKTQTVNKGVRTISEVVHCPCGKNFKGGVKDKVKLPKRF